MTVGELIEELRRMPAHVRVIVEGGTRPVDRVEFGKREIGPLPENVALIFTRSRRTDEPYRP